MIADAELHDFFTDLLNEVDVVLFGRKPIRLWNLFGQMPGTIQEAQKV